MSAADPLTPIGDYAEAPHRHAQRSCIWLSRACMDAMLTCWELLIELQHFCNIDLTTLAKAPTSRVRICVNLLILLYL